MRRAGTLVAGPAVTRRVPNAKGVHRRWSNRTRAAVAAGCGVLSLAVAAVPAAAQSLDSATIATTFQVTSIGTGGTPISGTGTGTFSISGPVSDSGTAELQLIFGALPAPSTGVLQSSRTLSGQEGTITLRCTQIAKNFSNPSAVPYTGSCTVIGGTGAYAGLHAHGTLTGVADLTTLVLSDILELSTA
jgi:hypothetical protein